MKPIINETDFKKMKQKIAQINETDPGINETDPENNETDFDLEQKSRKKSHEPAKLKKLWVKILCTNF